jgi:hypothetical protein
MTKSELCHFLAFELKKVEKLKSLCTFSHCTTTQAHHRLGAVNHMEWRTEAKFISENLSHACTMMFLSINAHGYGSNGMLLEHESQIAPGHAPTVSLLGLLNIDSMVDHSGHERQGYRHAIRSSWWSHL